MTEKIGRLDVLLTLAGMALVVCSTVASATVRTRGPGDDSLVGTKNNDRITGNGGNDTTVGKKSNDTYVYGDDWGQTV